MKIIPSCAMAIFHSKTRNLCDIVCFFIDLPTCESGGAKFQRNIRYCGYNFQRVFNVMCIDDMYKTKVTDELIWNTHLDSALACGLVHFC